jgi:hypothetical protein
VDVNKNAPSTKFEQVAAVYPVFHLNPYKAAWFFDPIFSLRAVKPSILTHREWQKNRNDKD